MDEVVDRHTSIGYDVPRSLYTDCGCCGGTLRTTSTNTVGTSVMGMWRYTYNVKLDAMHLMLSIGREINAEHPRRKKFLIDLSQAMFIQHEEDRHNLMVAREAAGLKGLLNRVERVKFIRRIVGNPESVAERMINAHREIDNQCRIQAEAEH